MDLHYFGTATVGLTIGSSRLLTDPAFDAAEAEYDFGPWYAPRAWFASRKTYATAPAPAEVDAFLLSHDQHADNLDDAGRRVVAASAAPVFTTCAGARRLARPAPRERASHAGDGMGLAARVHGLDVGATTHLGDLAITAMPARHGPRGTPQVHEVIGFLLEAPQQPTVWISGDTVLYPGLRAALTALREAGKRVDVAIVHCGGVAFPRVPVLGRELFTFDAAQAIEAVRLLDPGLVVPIHRDGWTHFRQSEAELRVAFEEAGLAARSRFLARGETLHV